MIIINNQYIRFFSTKKLIEQNLNQRKKKFYNLTLQEEEAKIDHLRVVVRVTNKLDDNNRTIRRIYYH